MTCILVAFDDYTLGAVVDDARIKSLDGKRSFLLLTPEARNWGEEALEPDGHYLTTLDEQLDKLQGEGVSIEHRWIPGNDLEREIVDAGLECGADGVVIAHHNPDAAFPDPGTFDDALRRDLSVPVDVIGVE